MICYLRINRINNNVFGNFIIYNILFIISYLFGSIPFGLILTKIFAKKDIRKFQSKNIGATNAFRVGGIYVGIFTLLFDGLKGAFAFYIAQYYQPSLSLICGLIAIIGHMFPLWLNFKGGKGVATFIFVGLALNYLIAIVAVLVWILIILLCGYASLSSIIMVIYYCLHASIQNDNYFTPLMTIMLLIIYKHRINLYNIIKNKENIILKKNLFSLMFRKN